MDFDRVPMLPVRNVTTRTAMCSQQQIACQSTRLYILYATVAAR